MHELFDQLYNWLSVLAGVFLYILRNKIAKNMNIFMEIDKIRR
jgi:hypothetical protein